MLEKDLILAAEVGQALLERNEELEAQLEQMRRDMEVRAMSLSSTSMVLMCAAMQNPEHGVFESEFLVRVGEV